MAALRRNADPGPIYQFCLLRVFEHVPYNATEILFVPHEVIVVLPLPELSGPAQNAVCLICGIRLPRVQNAGQLAIRQRLKNHMHVVRHQTPSKETISDFVEMEQRSRRHPRDSGIGQVGRSTARIQIRVDFLVKELREAFAFVERKLPPHRRGGSHDVPALEFKLLDHRVWQRICQAKRNEIRSGGRFPVR